MKCLVHEANFIHEPREQLFLKLRVQGFKFLADKVLINYVVVQQNGLAATAFA
jgi:hypothetical protein